MAEYVPSSVPRFWILTTGPAGFTTGRAGFTTGRAGFETGRAGFETGPAGFKTGPAGFKTGPAGVETGPAGWQVDKRLAWPWTLGPKSGQCKTRGAIDLDKTPLPRRAATWRARLKGCLAPAVLALRVLSSNLIRRARKRRQLRQIATVTKHCVIPQHAQ